MACLSCKLLNCQSGQDIALYSLTDALFFNGVALSFIVDCPENTFCPAGSFPRTVVYPPGTFVFPQPPPNPGQPIILQLMGCQSLVQRILPAGSSQAAILAAANQIIMEVAAQQAQCDSIPPEPPNPGNPPGPLPPHPPPSGGGGGPTPQPLPPFMNQQVQCSIEACPGDLTLTQLKPFPSWMTLFVDSGIAGFMRLVGAAGVFGGATQAAANAAAQGILNNLCATAYSAGYIQCTGGGGACAIFDALVWGVPVYVDGGVQTVTGSWVGANFSFSILAPVPNVTGSASNSASAPLTLTNPVIAFLDVTWISNPGNGALGFAIQVGTTNLGILQLVDQSTNLPAWNASTRYQFEIPITTADTLFVNVLGGINSSVARTASIQGLLTCIPADPCLIDTASPLPSAERLQAYSTTLTATGPTTPITWTVISGFLPTGLSLNSATGEISGTPTVIGTNSFTVKASGEAFECEKPFLLQITPAGDEPDFTQMQWNTSVTTLGLASASFAPSTGQQSASWNGTTGVTAPPAAPPPITCDANIASVGTLNLAVPFTGFIKIHWSFSQSTDKPSGSPGVRVKLQANGVGSDPAYDVDTSGPPNDSGTIDHQYFCGGSTQIVVTLSSNSHSSNAAAGSRRNESTTLSGEMRNVP